MSAVPDPQAPHVREPVRRVPPADRLAALTGGAAAAPLVALSAIQLLDEVDAGSVGVLSAAIRDWYGLDLTTLAVISTVSSFVAILGAVPVGILADRVHRARLVGLAALLQGVFSLLSSLAPSVTLFAGARLGGGLTRLVEPAQTSLVADSYPTERRPGVFAFRQGAQNVGRIVGPLSAGAAATWFTWQSFYVALALPLGGLGVYFLLRLREPARGAQERRSLGLGEAAAQKEDAPPSVNEAFRVIWGVRTLRRITYSLPLTAGASLGLGTLLPLYYADELGARTGTIGIVTAVTQPFAIVGLVIGGRSANRQLAANPSRVVLYAGGMTVLSALLIGATALAPNIYVAAVFACLVAGANSIVAPAALALLTVVVPARARGLGLSIGALAVVLGLPLQILAASIADDHGLRVGILVLVPVLIAGAAVLASAGQSVPADLRAATAAAAAQQLAEESQAAGSNQLLVVRDLDVAYGPVQILFGLDLEVQEGEIVALLGTNGAGKSTLLRAICGLTMPENGAIVFDGVDITRLPAYEHAAHRIVMMPGGKGVFPNLSVADNLRIATWSTPEEEIDAAMAEVYGFFPILAERGDEDAGNLSGGQQQMLALAQAFLAKPRLLLIDELSLGLAPVIVEQLLGIIREMRARGITVLIVEQSVNVALTIAERAVFLEKGEVRFSGPTAELLRRPDILRSVYLQGTGRSRSLAAPRRGAFDAPEPAAPRLEARGLTKRFGGVQAVGGVSFTLAEDTILGIIGPNGAGKTSLFDLLSGFTKPDEGELLLLGEDVTDLSADQRAVRGLTRSFQDARLFPALTVAESIAVSLEGLAVRSLSQAALRLPRVTRAERQIAARVERLLELFGLQRMADTFVRELSTGQRRIVDMACMLATEPKVVLLDEPSSGIAQKEAEELGPLLLRIQRETGCSMVVIEHDMPLLLSVSDELLALETGRPIASGAPDAVIADPRVVASYLGDGEATVNRSGRIAT